jgi:hypothetical protein
MNDIQVGELFRPLVLAEILQQRESERAAPFSLVCAARIRRRGKHDVCRKVRYSPVRVTTTGARLVVRDVNCIVLR